MSTTRTAQIVEAVSQSVQGDRPVEHEKSGDVAELAAAEQIVAKHRLEIDDRLTASEFERQRAEARFELLAALAYTDAELFGMFLHLAELQRSRKWNPIRRWRRRLDIHKQLIAGVNASISPEAMDAKGAYAAMRRDVIRKRHDSAA